MDLDQIMSVIQNGRKIRNKISESVQLYSLSFNEFEVLYVLSGQKESTPSKISEAMGQGSSTVSRILRSLCDKQLITLDTNHIDRRNITVKLTVRGEQLYAKSINKIKLSIV